MGRELETRRAGPDDLTALVALENRAFEDPWSEASWAGTLALDINTVLLVSRPQGVAASAVFQVIPDECELLRIAVDPQSRGQGIGSGLLSNGLELAYLAGARRCHLEVESTNLAAVSLYQRFGFRNVGRRPAYYGRSADGRPRDALLFRLDPIHP